MRQYLLTVQDNPNGKLQANSQKDISRNPTVKQFYNTTTWKQY